MKRCNTSYLFSEYKQRARHIILLRYALALSLFITMLIGNWSVPYILYNFSFISLVFILNTAASILVNKCTESDYQKLCMLSKMQTVLDIVLVTFIIFFTGGVRSNLLGLYFLNYIVAYYIVPDYRKLSFITFLGPSLFILFAVLEKSDVFSLKWLLTGTASAFYEWKFLVKTILLVMVISGVTLVIMSQIIKNLRDKLNRLQGVNNRLSALYNVSASLDKMYEAEHLVESVMKVIEKKLGFSSICLFFRLPGEKEWIYNCNDDELYEAFRRFENGESPDTFFRQNFTHGINYLVLDSKEYLKIFQISTNKSVAFIPVIIRSSVTGYLVVGSSDEEIITEENMILLAAIANQVGAIEENLKFFDIVQKGKKQWQNTFDALKDFILVIDREGRIIRANKAFIKALNTSYTDIIGENAKRILKIENEIIIPNTTDKPISKEIQFPHIDGTYLISLYPIYAEEFKQIDGGVYVISDVTALKRAEKNALVHLKEKERLNTELKDMFHGVIMLTASSIDVKSEWTAGHSERVAYHTVKIAQKMGMNPEDIENVRICSLLHDIGKISIPDHILNKRSKLQEDEYELIKKHPIVGARILSTLSHFEKIIPGVKHHHERWDGRGYPYGIGEREIPLYARIIGVVDAFDAMVSERPYRKGLPYEIAIEEIVNNKNTQFDPDIVSYFVLVLHEERMKNLENGEINIADAPRIM